MGCFIIAEAGVNHNGELTLAKELIHAAKESGADAVKFQTFNAENLVNSTAQKAEYQKKSSIDLTTQYQMLKSLELANEYHHHLIELAKSLEIEFMSTGFDEENIDFLVTLGVKRLKIPSGEITNLPYLNHVAQTRLPLIMSTGMSNLQEVKQALDVITPYYKSSLTDITLLHCTSNYPTAISDVNLRAMNTLANEFKLPVGYSDHTIGTLVPTLAVGMGASVIEKHFTLDKALEGPDHATSMIPAELKELVHMIREIEIALGSDVKIPAKNELPIRDLVRRSVTLKNNLPKGTLLKLEDLIILRPGTGISPSNLPLVVNKTLKDSLTAGTTLLWEHFEA